MTKAARLLKKATAIPLSLEIWSKCLTVCLMMWIWFAPLTLFYLLALILQFQVSKYSPCLLLTYQLSIAQDAYQVCVFVRTKLLEYLEVCLFISKYNVPFFLLLFTLHCWFLYIRMLSVEQMSWRTGCALTLTLCTGWSGESLVLHSFNETQYYKHYRITHY